MTILAILLFLIGFASAENIQDKFQYCQSREINRMLNPFPNCQHPIEMKYSYNKQHDINNLLLAEMDDNKHLDWIRTQDSKHNEFFHRCNMYKSQIFIISQDSFNEINDSN